eukprot:7431457-Lingulodinium_polyedra.AAC.1
MSRRASAKFRRAPGRQASGVFCGVSVRLWHVCVPLFRGSLSICVKSLAVLWRLRFGHAVWASA